METLICPYCNNSIHYEINDIKKFIIVDNLNEYYYINCSTCKKAFKLFSRKNIKEMI